MSDNDARAEARVEQGLKLYSQGRFDEAIILWRDALALIPGHARAREYIKYVEENRAALEASFRPSARDGFGAPQHDDGFGATQREDGALRGRSEEPRPESVALADALEADATPQVALESRDLPRPAAAPEVGGALAGDYVVRPFAAQGGAGRWAAPEDMHFGERMRPDLDPAEETFEHTARMNLDELKAKLDATRERQKTPVVDLRDQIQAGRADSGPRETPATLNPVVGLSVNRNRRATPLTLVDGGGRAAESFEPAERTPVSLLIPEPARLVSGAHGAAGDHARDSADVEAGSRPTPAGFAAVTAEDEPSVEILFQEDASGASPAAPAPPAGAPPLGERVESMVAGARQLFDQGTYEGSLWLCERVLSAEPGNLGAKELLEENRAVLLEQYVQQIGNLQGVPVVQIPQHEIMWHKLDHRAGFLLSRIDGQLTFEDIIDVSGMGEFEASRILAQLLALSVIGLRS